MAYDLDALERWHKDAVAHGDYRRNSSAALLMHAFPEMIADLRALRALRQDNIVQKNTAYVLLKAATETRERIEELEAEVRALRAVANAAEPFVADGYSDPMDRAVIHLRAALDAA